MFRCSFRTGKECREAPQQRFRRDAAYMTESSGSCLRRQGRQEAVLHTLCD